MILPRPKEVKRASDIFTGKIYYHKDCEKANWVKELLSLYAPTLICEAGEANLSLKKEEFDVTGSYRLTVTKEDITICYGDDEGIRNATASLAQLMEDDKIPCVMVYDAPDNNFRSAMLAFNRGYLEMDQVKETLVRLSLLKYNYVHFHMMDAQSYNMESTIVPDRNVFRTYTKEELKEMVAFCKKLGMTAIPELEFPGHIGYLVVSMPEIQCDIIDKDYAKSLTEGKPRNKDVMNEDGISTWAACIGKESTYEIYRKLMAEMIEIFDGPYVHIGGDEVRMRNVGAIPHWDNCYACKAMMEREGISTFRELFYYAIRRMHEIVKSFGKKTIIWNDQLEVLKPIDLPKDIIVEYWFSHQIRGEVGAEEAGVYQPLLDQGFTSINAHIHYAYPDMNTPDIVPARMTETSIKNWDTYTEYVGDKKLQGDIMGGEICAWSFANPKYFHYAYSLPVSLSLFCDRLWNHAPVEYDEAYKETIFRAMIGHHFNAKHPFGFFPEMIPPRDPEKDLLEEVDVEKISLPELQAFVKELKAIEPKKVYGKFALKAYIDCLEKIQKHMETI